MLTLLACGAPCLRSCAPRGRVGCSRPVRFFPSRVGRLPGTGSISWGGPAWRAPAICPLGPVGGVIMATYLVTWRGRYGDLATTALPAFNWVGLSAYAIGSLVAYTSNWVAPVVGCL